MTPVLITDTHMRAPGVSPDALISGFSKVIDSIIAIASEETAALKANRPFDIATMSMRKTRLLHDYNGAARSLDVALIDQSVREKMKLMHSVLEQNLHQFNAHASALREIVTLMMEAAQEQQNDGTYTTKTRYGI